MTTLSIIIVNYNTKKLTLDCIKSIQKFAPKFNYEIIVVDNASLNKLTPQKFKLIQNSNNLGFSKANNQGIRMALGKYILLLNSDIVVQKGALDALVNFAEITPDAGVIGSRLLNPDLTIQPSVFNFPTVTNAVVHYWFNKKILGKYAPEENNPTQVDAVVGAAFLITPKALKKVGLLNEKYFMYFEDIDYCRKVRSVGMKVYYLPSSEIIHMHGASGGKNKYLIDASKAYHGLLNYYLITFVIRISQIFDKITK